MTKKQKKVLIRIIVSAVFLVAMAVTFAVLDKTGMVKLENPSVMWRCIEIVAYLIPYLIIGYDVLRKAFMGIVNGQVFDENFLMAIATVGAYATGDFDEAVFVMLFYQTGELFQDYAVGKSRASITALMDIRPDTANLETENGLEEVDPEDVPVGSVIVVKPGERVPLDGTVTELGEETVPYGGNATLPVIEIPDGCEVTWSGTLSGLTDEMDKALAGLENALSAYAAESDITKASCLIRDRVLPAMDALRAPCDKAETLTAESYWPFPNYGDLLFGVR